VSGSLEAVPEGDSVHKLARRLDRSLTGQEVVRSELRVPRLATRDLAGRTVVEHATHGKHLLTRFAGGVTLHTHLRMDGSWTVTRPGRSLPRRLLPDVRVLLETAAGHTAYGLLLPVVDLVATDEEHTVVGHLGPDPLRDDWDADEAVRRLGTDPGRPLVSALLDQRLVAGLGNLWANELCFLVGRSPWTPVGEVDLAQVVRLAARALRHSALVPGAYQVTTGTSRRGEDHWVSGRRGRPCLRCGTTIRMVEALPNDPDNRVTWWCPHCQPGPERPLPG
jgi:endonuclease VIII